MTGASRALLPSSSNTCNSLSVVLGRPRGVPLREDCNRREKQMQKQAWQAPTSGSSTLAEEPTQHISNTCSSSHKSSDQQQQCSEARPVPSFRACACYQNTFFSRPSLPREHCRVRCPLERRRWPPRLRPDPSNRDARQKNYNTGAPMVGDAWDLPSSPQPWDVSVSAHRSSGTSSTGTRCTSFAVRGHASGKCSFGGARNVP